MENTEQATSYQLCKYRFMLTIYGNSPFIAETYGKYRTRYNIPRFLLPQQYYTNRTTDFEKNIYQII